MNNQRLKLITIVILNLAFNRFSVEAQQIIPLKVGNKWTYTKTISEDQLVKKEDTTFSYIEKSVQVNGNSWYVSYEDGYKYLVRDKGGEQFELDSATVDVNGKYNEFLVFGLPEKGQTLKYQVGGETVTVKDFKHTVKTKAGKFKCFKYEFRAPYDDDGFIDTYISPGIGIVKVVMATGNEIITLHLIDYKIH